MEGMRQIPPPRLDPDTLRRLTRGRDWAKAILDRLDSDDPTPITLSPAAQEHNRQMAVCVDRNPTIHYVPASDTNDYTAT